MTTLVLLLLGGIWAVVLIVPFVRARSEGSLGDSIGTFRRHLSVLERAGPTSVNPANRLRMPANQAAIPPYRPPASSQGGRSRQSGFGPAVSRRSASYAPTPSAQRRHQAQRRRRDVLLALLAGMAGSFLLSWVHGLGVMLVVHVILDILFVCYLGLLVRLRNIAAEREMKLTFLPTAANARMAGGRPAYARAGGYDDGSEYGLPAGY